MDGLKDVYYAEKKIVKTLPKLAKAAQSKPLSAAFERHLAETEGQVERLEQIFEQLGNPARGKTRPAIDGLLEEGSEILEEYKDMPALDAGLVGAAQAVEDYEIARYGTLIAWAEQLGMKECSAAVARNPQARISDRRGAEPTRRERSQRTCVAGSLISVSAPFPRRARNCVIAFPWPGCSGRRWLDPAAGYILASAANHRRTRPTAISSTKRHASPA